MNGSTINLDEKETNTDNADRIYGHTTNLMDKRTRTGIRTMRLIHGIDSKVVCLILIAWLLFCIMSLVVILSHVVNIAPSVLTHNYYFTFARIFSTSKAFHFTRPCKYKNLFTCVQFFLGRVFELLVIPVIINLDINSKLYT